MPFCVLVVADDLDTRATLSALLERDGYQVDSVGTAAEVLARDDWGRYGAILLDCRLPDGTAEELLPRLRERAPDTAVVVVTEHADVRGAIEAFRLGAADYALKPIDPDELRARLGRIVEHRRAREALQHREEELQAVLDALPVGVWLTDAEGQIEYGNPAARAIWGRASHAEVDGGEGPKEWRSGTDRPDTPDGRALARALRGEPVLGEVVDIEVAGATRKLVLTSAVPLRADDGGVRGAVVINQDLTERRRAEAAFRESERRFRELLEKVKLVAVMLDAEGRVAFCNDYLLQLTGWGREEVERKSWFTLFIPEEVRAEVQRIFFDPALREQIPTQFENEILTRTGERRLIAWNNTVLRDSEGGVIGVTSLGEDITKRRRAEEGLRESEARLVAILNTASEAIITVDNRGIIQTVNPAAAALFDYTAGEMIGQKLRMLMPPTFRDDHDEDLAQFLDNRQARIIGTDREMAARRKDGTVFPIGLAVSPINHLGQFTVIIRDLTQRKELEREVLEVASREQRRIGQDIHDTVGQELTALNILARDLADTLPTDPTAAANLAERLTRGLRRSQQQLRVVIRGLLPVPVDRDGLMAALADLADRTSQDSPVACAFHCPEPVSVADNLTATHLYLIAQEAVHNAVKHARPRHIRITLTNGNGLVLRVRDDGVGLPSPPEEGRGLGLRIMDNRAAIIGARLTVEPASSAGTVVTCELTRTSKI